jgi:hypothetical protein
MVTVAGCGRRARSVMAPGPGGGMAVRTAREPTFCHTREPAGVLEMLAWSPAVQKAAGPVMPERTGTGGTAASGRSRMHDRTRTWSGNFSSPPFKVYHIF